MMATWEEVSFEGTNAVSHGLEAGRWMLLFIDLVSMGKEFA